MMISMFRPLPCTESATRSKSAALPCKLTCKLRLKDWRAGTGGIVDLKHWRNIDWTPIHALTGGSDKFQTGLGLKPWYVRGHTHPQGPGKTSSCALPSTGLARTLSSHTADASAPS